MKPGDAKSCPWGMPSFPQGQVPSYDDELPIPAIILADFPIASTPHKRQTHLQNKAP